MSVDVHHKIRSPMAPLETLGEISAAINLIEIKKQNLHKSFLHLQSQSSSSPNFNLNLNWTDFDSYFTTLSSSLRHKFHLLKTLNPSSTTTSLLKHFCRNSDGIAIRRYIINAPNRPLMLGQLPDAYRCAPDAAAMVLDAMAGFYSGKGIESCLIKSGCTIMLEGLLRMNPDIRVELRDKAMKLAVEWNRKRLNSPGKAKGDDAFGFLLLVAAYGLMDGFEMNKLIDCFVIVVRRRQKFDLCRKIIPANKINDLIQELINKEMLVDAVKFSIEFQKTDEFPPAHLLEQRKLMSMRIMEETRKNENDHQHEVIVKKEINALRSMIKCIDEYGLESEYPKDTMVDLVKKLENEAGCRKRLPKVAVHKKQQLSKPKKRKLNNFIETAASAIPTTVQNVQEQPYSQATDHVGQNHGPLAWCTPTAPYGSTGLSIGYAGPGGSRFYVPQSHPPPGWGYFSNLNELAGGYQPFYYPH